MFGPDICLCSGIGCSLRDTCLRYKYHLKAKKEDYNTYFETSPIYNGKCDFYIRALYVETNEMNKYEQKESIKEKKRNIDR